MGLFKDYHKGYDVMIPTLIHGKVYKLGFVWNVHFISPEPILSTAIHEKDGMRQSHVTWMQHTRSESGIIEIIQGLILSKY